MYSKHILFRIALLPVFLLVAGCNLFDNTKPADEALSLSNHYPGCLATFSEELTDYTQGKTQTDAEIDKTWDCASGSLTFFIHHTKGADENTYLATELERFLNLYLFRDHKLTDELFSEIMKIKRALLDGSTTSLSKSELARVQELLTILRVQSKILRPYMPLTAAHARSLDADQAQKLYASLSQAGLELGGFFDRAGDEYRFEDLRSMIANLAKFLSKSGSEDPQSLLAWLERRVPLLAAAKAVFIGPDALRIEKNEWSKLLRIGGRLEGLTLLLAREENALPSRKWISRDGFAALSRVLPATMDLFLETRSAPDVDSKPLTRVTATEVQRLIQVVAEITQNPDASFSDADRQISEMTSKGLLAKQILLGGEAFEIDLEHLARIPLLYTDVKEPILDLIQNFPWDLSRSISNDEYLRYTSAIGPVSQKITAAIQKYFDGRSDYRFLEFEKLFQAVKPFLQDEEWKEGITEVIPILEPFKALVSKPPYGEILPEDWKLIVDDASDAYRAVLAWLVKSPASDTAPFDQVWDDISLKIERMLLSAAQMTETHPLFSENLVELVDKLPQKLYSIAFPDSFTRTHFEQVIVAVAKLKKELLGGKARDITSTQLSTAAQILRDSRQALGTTLKLTPHQFSDFSDWDEERTLSFLKQLKEAGDSLSQTLQKSAVGGGIRASDVDLLLRSTEPLDQHGFIAQALDYIPLIFSIKAVVSAPPSDKIETSQLPIFAQNLSSWLALAIRGYRLYERSPNMAAFFRGENLEETHATLDGMLSLLPGIATSDVENFVDELWALNDKKGWGIPFRHATFRAVIRPLVQNIFGGTDQGPSGRAALGFTKPAVDQMRSKMERFYRIQRTFNDIFVELAGGPQGLGEVDGFPGDQISSLLGRNRIALYERSDRGSAQNRYEVSLVNEARALLEYYPPLYLKNDEFVSYVYDGHFENLYTYSHFWHVNFLWHVGEILINAYVQDPARATPGQGGNLKEFQVGLGDFWNLLLDVKEGDPKSTAADYAEKRIREANIFLVNSDGNELISQREFVEVLAINTSSRDTNTEIYNLIHDHCKSIGFDHFGKSKFEPPCVRKIFYAPETIRHFYGKKVPRLVQYLDSLSAKERQKFFHGIEDAGRAHHASDIAPYENGEIGSISTVFYYIESMFKRFDTDRNGTLDLAETKAAFPIVCLELHRAASDLGRCEEGHTGGLEALFGYLLVYGEPPAELKGNVFQKVGAAANWVSWLPRWWAMNNIGIFEKNLAVDRSKILQIISSLANR